MNNTKNMSKTKVTASVQRQMADLPPWAVRITDGEVLTVISIEIGCFVYNDRFNGEVEDSRSLELLCYEAAVLFCKEHRNTDWGDGMFVDCIDKFTSQICEALSQEPDWINGQFHAMYGHERLEDLLARNREDQFKELQYLEPGQTFRLSRESNGVIPGIYTYNNRSAYLNCCEVESHQGDVFDLPMTTKVRPV